MTERGITWKGYQGDVASTDAGRVGLKVSAGTLLIKYLRGRCIRNRISGLVYREIHEMRAVHRTELAVIVEY